MRDTPNPSHAEAPDVVHDTGVPPGSAARASADLRAATRYYERHVIAWYALGRLWEARAARDAIARLRQELAPQLHSTSSGPPHLVTS
jgi:hypothetical protein